MERHEVRSIVREFLEEHISEKSCPVCKGTTTFMSVSYWPDEGEEDFDGFRCMKCLNYFWQKLQQIREG